MARKRTYGWSPEQLARINARREARGQEAYIDKRFSDEDYAKRYIGQSESYAAKKNKPAMPESTSERPSALDQYKEQKSLRDRMAERPSALGNQPSSMESRRAIADEEFRRKTGRGAKGISTPMTKDAMDRVMGLA